MKYTIKPEEHELREAQNVVKQTVETCKTVLPKEENLEIGLGWTNDEFTLDEMGGTGAEETMNSTELTLNFNSSVGKWKDNLKRTTAHEYAHTVFWENKEEITLEWEWVLFEAHGMLFADKISQNTKTPWAEKFSNEEIKEMWAELREAIGKESDGWSLWYGSEEWPKWIGYTLSYKIGQKLLENHDLEEFPDLKRSDVIEAGDELFG